MNNVTAIDFGPLYIVAILLFFVVTPGCDDSYRHKPEYNYPDDNAAREARNRAMRDAIAKRAEQLRGAQKPVETDPYKTLYYHWIEKNPGYKDLTYGEWRFLREAGKLPSQDTTFP